MKQKWLTGEMFKAVFPLPNEVFQLGLKAGDLLVYIYLQYQKGMRNNQCWPSYATIGEAVGMSRKTVQKHVWALVDKGLVQTENTTVRRRDGHPYNGNLLYTLTPVGVVLKEREKELLAQLKLAVAYLTDAAEQNNSQAQYILGKLYLLGQDVEQDKEIAE